VYGAGWRNWGGKSDDKLYSYFPLLINSYFGIFNNNHLYTKINNFKKSLP
jgi:hypothetical protein